MTALPSRRIPDPTRAHGAWVYLAVSVLAGALSVAGRGTLPALLAGLGYAGVFLLASSAALWPRPTWRRRGAAGLLLATGAPWAALATGADPAFLAYALVALFPAALAGWFGFRRGFLSPLALCFAVAALTVAAPSAACAGGGTAREGWMLGLLLPPFFVWRTWRLRRALGAGGAASRAELRRRGLREAALAVGWTALAVAAVHLLPPAPA